MEDNAFEVRLCGDMVKDGNMPLDDYINYLSNLTKLCKSANDVLNPGTKLDFRIDGNIKKGSIINVLIPIIHGIGVFAATQTPYSFNDIMTLLGFLNDGRMSLLEFLDKRKDKKIKSKIIKKDGNVTFEFEGEGDVGTEYLEVSREIINLEKNKQVRDGITNTLELLKREGYEKIGFKSNIANKADYQYVDKKSLESIKYVNKREDYTDVKTYNAIVDIENVPPLKPDNKWQFREKAFGSYWAYIRDPEFMEYFKKNGIQPPFSLKVTIKLIEQYNKNDELIKSSKEIIKVIEIIKLETQEPLNL